MKTKIIMNIGILADIESASLKLKIRRSVLIKLLVKCFEKDNRKYITLNRNVRYQEKDEPGNWKQFHLYLTEPEYERFTDMRKFCKMSFSLIVAFSVKKYLKKLLDPKGKRALKQQYMDNWPDILFPAYCLFWQKGISGHKFLVYWGIPDKLPEN